MKKTGDETVKREQNEGQYVGRENEDLEENKDSDKQVVLIVKEHEIIRDKF
jgi:hypothetical protein